MYWVNWVGYGIGGNTWEPAENLAGAQETVDAYERGIRAPGYTVRGYVRAANGAGWVRAAAPNQEEARSPVPPPSHLQALGLGLEDWCPTHGGYECYCADCCTFCRCLVNEGNAVRPGIFLGECDGPCGLLMCDDCRAEEGDDYVCVGCYQPPAAEEEESEELEPEPAAAQPSAAEIDALLDEMREMRRG